MFFFFVVVFSILLVRIHMTYALPVVVHLDNLFCYVIIVLHGLQMRDFVCRPVLTSCSDSARDGSKGDQRLPLLSLALTLMIDSFSFLNIWLMCHVRNRLTWILRMCFRQLLAL